MMRDFSFSTDVVPFCLLLSLFVGGNLRFSPTERNLTALLIFWKKGGQCFIDYLCFWECHTVTTVYTTVISLYLVLWRLWAFLFSSLIFESAIESMFVLSFFRFFGGSILPLVSEYWENLN